MGTIRSEPVIAVIGAGIGGLSAAVALAAQGCRVDIFERSPELREIGAGVQLSPNATRILHTLGLTDRLANRWRVPQALHLLSGSSLRRLASLPMGDTAEKRWSAPYAVIHRAGLQRVLADAVVASANCQLHLGTAIEATAEAATIQRLVELTGREPNLIVVADGVWTGRRGGGTQIDPARFTGHVAWRAMAERDRLPFLEASGDLNAFLRAKTHLVTYPLGASGLVNVVAISPGRNPGTRWDAKGDSQQLERHFSRWRPDIAGTLAELDWQYWPLFEARNDLWRDGKRTVLIGDAAHAMTPFAAQGAAMAIEDAYELAVLFQREDGDVASTVSAFEAIRRPRIARVRRRGDFNRFTYHATGPFRIGRDVVLSLRGGDALLADFDWLYGYRAGAH